MSQSVVFVSLKTLRAEAILTYGEEEHGAYNVQRRAKHEIRSFSSSPSSDVARHPGFRAVRGEQACRQARAYGRPEVFHPAQKPLRNVARRGDHRPAAPQHGN